MTLLERTRLGAAGSPPADMSPGPATSPGGGIPPGGTGSWALRSGGLTGRGRVGPSGRLPTGGRPGPWPYQARSISASVSSPSGLTPYPAAVKPASPDDGTSAGHGPWSSPRRGASYSPAARP